MNILCPTDFSENAYKAVQYFYTHFDIGKVNIHLIHVIQEPHTTSSVLLRLDDIMMKDAKKEMSNLLERIERDFNHSPKFSIHYGYLKDWVHLQSANTGIDMIVMGTKGENNLASKLMGSVTESIIRTSHIPTLAIPDVSLKEDIQEIVFATQKKNLDNRGFLESLLRSLKLNTPHLNTLVVLSEKDRKGLPKSLDFNHFQIGVKTIQNDSVVKGINQFLESNRVDILALYHTRNSRLDYLFNRSITKTICGKTRVPLLVMPLAG